MNRSSLSRLLAALSLLAPIALAHAQTPGSLDPAYQNPATSEPADVVIAQTVNGITKAILGGSFDSLLDAARTPVPGFARFNADGSLDSAFLANITGTTVYSVTALALQPDGKILVAGFDSSVSTGQGRELLRFNADGTPDSAFRVTVDDNIESIAFQPGGNILISGLFQTVNGVGNQRCLARLSPAGVLDTTFQAYTNNALTIMEVKRIAVLPGGGVLAVTHVSEGFVDYLIQLSGTDGSVPDAPPFFDLINDGRIYDMTVDSAGNVVVVGNFGGINNHPRDYPVARFAANGQLDLNFVGGPPLASVLLQSVVVDASGRPLVGGVSFFTSVLFRLTADIGIVDSTFSFPLGNDGNFIQSLALEPSANGAVLAAGQYAIGQRAANLVRVILGASTGGGGGGGNLIVPGTANPYLAGLPDGTTASGGDDSAPAESPLLVPGLTLHANIPLNFSVAGSVSTDAAVQPTEGPDGGFFFKHAEENFISPIVAPINSLVGVFLSDTASDSTGVHDIVRDYSDAANTNGGVNYLGYQPRLGEPFFIGDGKTSAGVVQNVFPPAGATRLFLGVLDGNDYFNNLGQFNVGVTQNTDIDSADLRLGENVSTPTDSSGATALIGDQITYTFHVKNEGSHPFTNVVVKDILPGVYEFVSASDGGTFKGGIVTWNLGTLAPSTVSKDLTLVVKTFVTGDSGQNVSAAQINQVIANTDYYVTADGLPQVVAGLDLTFPTTLKAPVSVAISSNSATVTPGGTVSYAIDLTDNVPVTPGNPKGKVKTTFSLTLPAGVKFLSAAFLDDSGVAAPQTPTDENGSFTSALGSFTYNAGGAVTYTPANLKANGVAHLVLTVLVPYDVEPAASIDLLAGKLTTKTSDDSSQNSYGVAVPDTKLSAAAVTKLPKLSLTKTTVDPYSLAQLFLFDSKDAGNLASAFPIFPFYTANPSDPSHPLINPDALIDVGQTLNPYIGQDLETGVLTITAPSSKAPVTYATFALSYNNEGNVNTDKIVINDPIPDGFAYDPAGLPTDPSVNPIPAPFVLINGAKPTLIPGSNPPAYSDFQVRSDGRALIFSPGKAKMGKPGLIVYQLRVTGPTVGQTVQVPRAALTTNSLNATTYSDSGVGESLMFVGPQSYALEPQNNGNYTRIGDQVNFDLFYTNTGVAKYKDFLVECQVPSGVTFAGSAVLAANGHDVSAAGPAPDASGRIIFHLGKLKSNKGGFVRVTYTLGAALRTANKPVVVNSWIASEADINDNFPQAAHRVLTRAMQARPGARAASGTTGNPVALSTTLVNDPSVPRLFIAKMAPLAVVPDKPYDYLIAVGNLSDIVAGGDRTNTSQGIIATETLPPDVTFVSLTGNDSRSVTVKGNVVTYQIPAIAAHNTALIDIKVKPNAGSTGKTLMSSSQVDIPNGPFLGAKPTVTRVVAAGQIGLQAASVAGDALTASGFKSTALPNLGKELDLSKNMVVCAGADFLYFNNGALLIPQGNDASTLFGDASSVSYPVTTAIGGVQLSANGGVLAVDASGVLSVRNLADNAQRTVVDNGGVTCEQIINDLYTASPNNLVRKSTATPNNGGGLNLYGADGNSFLNNQPTTAPQTINRGMVLGVKGAVIPAGLANATLLDEGILKADRLITQDGGGLITQDGGGLISQDGGGLVAQGGGNLIIQDGAGLITQDGGGLVAQGGGNLVAQGGGNLVAQGGGNLVAQGGGNVIGTPPGSTLVAQGGGNLVVAGSSLVAQGGGNLVAQGGGNAHPNTPPARK